MAAILADAKRAREVAEQQARRQWELVKLGDASDLRVARPRLRLDRPGGRDDARAPSTARWSASRAARATASTASTSSPALLPEADVVVNLLPLTDATRGAVGAGELAAMRDGALYVNAGRGATTDTDALVDALRAGRIRAVLDVVDPEPLPADHPLWTAPGRGDQPAQRGRHPRRRARRVGAGGRAAAPLRGRRGARERGQRRL